MRLRARTGSPKYTEAQAVAIANGVHSSWDSMPRKCALRNDVRAIGDDVAEA
jgi:hypothetical protein